MTVLKIIAGILVIVTVLYALGWMQAYSEKRYRYQLFSVGSFALLVIGWILFFLAIYTLPENGTLDQAIAAALALTFPEPLSNSIVLLALATTTFLYVLLLLVVKTNLLFGVIGWVVQLVGSVLIVPFLILLIPSSKKKKGKQARYIRVDD